LGTPELFEAPEERKKMEQQQKHINSTTTTRPGNDAGVGGTTGVATTNTRTSHGETATGWVDAVPMKDTYSFLSEIVGEESLYGKVSESQQP